MTTRSSVKIRQRADRAFRHRRAPLIVAIVLVGCTGAGAALGSGTHPAPSAYFRAESELTVTAPTQGLQSVAWHTLDHALTLPSLRAEIAQLGGEEISALHVGTLGDPESSLITVYADGASPTQADSLASAAVSVAVNFLRQTVYASTVTRSTFDESTDGWDLGAGIFVLPAQIQQTRQQGHNGPGALAATCPTSGCGPYLVLDRTFLRGTTYTATGWVNAPPSTRMRIVLGSTPRDVAVGATLPGGTGWKRFSVEWTPQDKAPRAVVTFQVMSFGTSRFFIDDVEVGPRTAVEGHVTQNYAPQYRLVVPAAVSGTLSAGDTASWAAGGAGGGLFVGSAAVAAGAAATRRRKRDRAIDRHMAL
jgi:hypothetical protein